MLAGTVIGYAFGGNVFTGGDAMGGGGYAVGAVLLGAVGTVAGGIIGYNAGGHWRDVQVAPAIGARGSAVRIALRF